MSSVDLFERIKNKDNDALNDLMSVYGKRVYMHLLNGLGDVKLADMALKKTMLEFYDSVGKSDAEDPIEAMLYERANTVRKEMSKGAVQELISDAEEDMLPELSDIDSKFEAAFSEQSDEPDIEIHDELPDLEAESEADNTEDEIPKKKSGCLIKLITTLIMIILFAAVIWVAAGGLMTAGYIPQYDLGYTWFNENIYPLFTMI